MMNSKVFRGMSLGLLAMSAGGFASADAISEYESVSSWDAAVSNVSTYSIPHAALTSDGVVFPTIFQVFGPSETVGPGTFTTPGTLGIIYSDGNYGTGVNYVSSDPAAFGGGIATVVESFSASSDLTALMFQVGTNHEQANIDVSVNGHALAPLTFSAGSGGHMLGVTDTSAITSISFTTVNAKYSPGNNNVDPGEMDVIGKYQTGTRSATLVAPEIDPASAASGVALLLGGLAVLRGRKRRATSALLPG